MKNKTFYIVTIHNKENLIDDVLNGIKFSHSNILPPTIICVLDGCTDKSEEKVLSFKNSFQFKDDFHIIYANDIHEILSLNTALDFIKEKLNPELDDVVVMIQDDIVLQEISIDEKLAYLYSKVPNLGYISLNIGVSGTVANNEIIEYDFVQSEFGHWNQLNWNFHLSLPHGSFFESEIVIRSPAIMQWKRFQEVGFFDEKMAPAGFDCHDMSIRMKKAGYNNGVYVLKFKSDINWGSMRGEKAAENDFLMNKNYIKNRKYIAQKHADYFQNKGLKNLYG